MMLLALLLIGQASHPLIDEGPRWECATLIGTFDDSGPKQQRLIFWRRDSFNRLWPAGEVDWLTVSWHEEHDGYRFTWHEPYEACFRTLKVPRLDWEIVDLRAWRVSWPCCPADMRGFLPNPEKRED